MRDCTEFDPLQPTILQDPYPWYSKLRAQGRLLWHTRLNAWLVPHYHDCTAVFGDPARYTADPRRVGAPLPDSSISIQTSDPPEHTQLRDLLAEGFRLCSMRAIEHDAIAFAEDLAVRLAREGGGELMQDFAIPLASHAICAFLGVPVPDLESLRPMSDAIIAGMDTGLDPRRGEPAQRARAELSALVASWAGRSRPDGLLGFLEQRRQNIPAFVIHNSARVVFHAGYTSVYSALGNAAHTILRHRLDWRQFADASSSAPAVEELLRFDGPVQVNSRIALEDADFAGGHVRRGDTLLLLLGSAHRDPAAFDRPEQLDLRRHPNKHLAFGWGIHQCLGGAFARRIVRVALAQLAAVVPELAVSGTVEHKPQATQRCLHRLPVARATARGSHERVTA